MRGAVGRRLSERRLDIGKMEEGRKQSASPVGCDFCCWGGGSGGGGDAGVVVVWILCSRRHGGTPNHGHRRRGKERKSESAESGGEELLRDKEGVSSAGSVLFSFGRSVG